MHAEGFSYIAWLEKQLDELESGQGGSPQKVFGMLVGAQRRWWKCCQEAAHDDPGWLFQPRTESIRRQIGKSAVSGGDATGDSMVAVADTAFLVARALSVPPDQAQEQAGALMRIARQWDGSGLLVSSQPPGTGPVTGRGVPALEEGLARRLESLIAALQPSVGDVVTTSPAARAMVEITARLLAGAERRKRPVVRVSVVFGSPRKGPKTDSGNEQGAAGYLELREFPAGPPGLFPDPQAMTGARSNGPTFANSLSHAWQSCPAGRCVLWRIILPDDPSSIPPIQGGSLGLAFALGLRALFRYPASRRPTLAWLRGFFYGLRPRTAVTGGIDEHGNPQLVTDMGGKLSAAHWKQWRLVAPEANRADIHQAPDPSMVRFATTIKQADRYARQWRTGRLAVAGAVAAAAVTSGLLVAHQESIATYRQQTASRLADVSSSLLNADLPEAQLLAVEAYRLEQDPQTLAALFQAATSSPALVRYLQAGAPVSAMYGAADGKSVVAGTSQGQVLRWNLAGGARVTIASLGAPVTATASDADGTVTAAATASEVVLWTSAGGTRRLMLPLGGSVDAVAVSPSGRYVAVASQGRSAVLVALYDRKENTARSVEVRSAPFAMAMPGDNRLVFATAGGPWQSFSLPQLKNVLGPTTLSTGVHQVVEALSANGQYTGYSNGGAVIAAWRTSHNADLGTVPDLFGLSHGSDPQALGISPDGKRVAVADGGTIYVSNTSHSANVSTSQTALPGTDSTTAVQFIGDDDHLVSATGTALALWNLSQPSRIGEEIRALAPSSCNACPPPQTEVSPDGNMMATLAGSREGSSTAVYIHALWPGGPQYSISGGIEDGYQLLGWDPNGSKIFIIKETEATGDIFQSVEVNHGIHVNRQYRITQSQYGPLAYSQAGGRLLELSNSGNLRIAPIADDRKAIYIPSPISVHDPLIAAAPDPSLSFLAEEFEMGTSVPPVAQMRLIDLKTGSSRKVGSGGVANVFFSGPYLLIQRTNGNLEAWNTSGTAMKYLIQPNVNVSDKSAALAASQIVAGSLLVQEDSDGTLAVTQLSSGRLLGSLSLPDSAAGRVKTGLALDGADHLVSTTEGESLDGEGTFVRWELSPDLWMRAACTATGRSMTPGDWQHYIDGAMPGFLACAN